MMMKTVLPALFVLAGTASEVLAFGSAGGAGKGLGGGSGGGGSTASAPEFDGPGGVAAIALLVSAGLIAYHRYKKK